MFIIKHIFPLNFESAGTSEEGKAWQTWLSLLQLDNLMERALLGSLLGENSSLSRWVHGWSLVHHLQHRYTSNLQKKKFLFITGRSTSGTCLLHCVEKSRPAPRQHKEKAHSVRMNALQIPCDGILPISILSRRVGRISVKVGFLFDMVWRSCWSLLLCYLKQLGPYGVDRGEDWWRCQQIATCMHARFFTAVARFILDMSKIREASRCQKRRCIQFDRLTGWLGLSIS